MDIRQSNFYAEYLQSIGWDVKKVDKWNIFIRNIPLYGKFAKLQRIQTPVPFDEIKIFAHRCGINKLIIEPDIKDNKITTAQFLAQEFKVYRSPYIPTKTLHINLMRSEDEIFESFSSAKRRAIRKAKKNKISILESQDINSFIDMKTKNMFPVNFIMARDITSLWNTFPKNSKSLLLAYINKDPIAGVMLLFFSSKAYYWYAASTHKGNQFAAPSLLVWKSLLMSKKRGNAFFDFEGVYDERFPKTTRNWKGFSKFKEGFGSIPIQYLSSFYI